MKYFKISEKDFADLYEADVDLPKSLTIFEDGTAYADTYADSNPWDEDFFYPEEETFEKVAKDYGATIED